MTNLYATTLTDNGATKGRKHWRLVSMPKLLAWYGVCILMGCNRVPNTRLHWSRYNEYFWSQYIMNVMSRNRFEAIFRCLHLVDNDEVVPNKSDARYDKL